MSAWVRMFANWVPYPFQNNIRYLPKQEAYECMAGLIEAQTKRDHKKATNFGEFIDAVFGDGISKHFMRPYNFKVWAHPAEMMNKEWIGERVAVLDINRALKNVMLGGDDFGWGPNNQFKFPLFGGTGEFYRRFEKPLAGHVQLNKTVDFINMAKKEIRFKDGEVVRYDKLITSLPLDVLCNDVLNGEVPREIKKATQGLKKSGGHMVGICLKQPCPSTKSWMYFPEDNCPFYRVTYLSNYSKYMTPDAATHYSLLCETSYSDLNARERGHDRRGHDRRPDQRRAAQGGGPQRHRLHLDVPRQVQLPDADRRPGRDPGPGDPVPGAVRHLLPAAGFGMWKYEVANTDHSLMQGVEVVNRLVLGEAESTIGIKYESTLDGRNAATHERSHLAGSGDPKKMKELAELTAAKSTAKVHPAGEPTKPTPHFNVTTAARPTNAPGDKTEVHVSEEELGVTVPLPQEDR